MGILHFPCNSISFYALYYTILPSIIQAFFAFFRKPYLTNYWLNCKEETLETPAYRQAGLPAHSVLKGVVYILFKSIVCSAQGFFYEFASRNVPFKRSHTPARSFLYMSRLSQKKYIVQTVTADWNRQTYF